jgi:hypothetical protein
MKQSKYAQDWFDEKYGESVKPFHAEIIMNQQPSTKINSTNQLDFNYFYKTGSGIKERSRSDTKGLFLKIGWLEKENKHLQRKCSDL